MSEPNEVKGPISWLTSYYWSGYAVQTAAETTLFSKGRHQLIMEFKLSHARSSIPVYQGDADVINNAAHLLIGYQFK